MNTVDTLGLWTDGVATVGTSFVTRLRKNRALSVAFTCEEEEYTGCRGRSQGDHIVSISRGQSKRSRESTLTACSIVHSIEIAASAVHIRSPSTTSVERHLALSEGIAQDPKRESFPSHRVSVPRFGKGRKILFSVCRLSLTRRVGGKDVSSG